MTLSFSCDTIYKEVLYDFNSRTKKQGIGKLSERKGRKAMGLRLTKATIAKLPFRDTRDARDVLSKTKV